MRTIDAQRATLYKAGLAVLAVAFTMVLGFSNSSLAVSKANAEDRPDGRKCTEKTVSGTYGFALVGSVVGVGPVSTSGVTIFDGAGHDSGQYAVTTSSSFQHGTFSGTYTVNADCTGAAVLTVSPAISGYSQLHFAAVATDNEREIKWLITDPGMIVAGTLTKQ